MHGPRPHHRVTPAETASAPQMGEGGGEQALASWPPSAGSPEAACCAVLNHIQVASEKLALSASTFLLACANMVQGAAATSFEPSLQQGKPQVLLCHKHNSEDVSLTFNLLRAGSGPVASSEDSPARCRVRTGCQWDAAGGAGAHVLAPAAGPRAFRLRGGPADCTHRPACELVHKKLTITCLPMSMPLLGQRLMAALCNGDWGCSLSPSASPLLMCCDQQSLVRA